MFKIKSCPFCGSDDIAITPQEVYEKTGNGCVCITCKNCSADVYRFGDAETPYERAMREAVIKWNTRIEEEEEA